MTNPRAMDASSDQWAEFRPWQLGYLSSASVESLPYLRCRAGRNEFLIPRTEDRCEGLLNLYQPTRLKGRALKSALSVAVKNRWQCWPMERINLNIRALRRLVEQVTGVANAVIAFRVGTCTRHQKLIAQASLPSGQMVAILKLPLTQTSVGRVIHEAQILALLNANKNIAGGVPRLLHAGKFEGSFVLVQTPADADWRPGSCQFVAIHEQYLDDLHQACKSRKTPDALLGSVWKACSGLRHSAELYSIIKRISHGLGNNLVECSLTHGDFAPWNTRVRNGSLYVFDWEAGTTDRPCIWDEFHFRTQAAALLKGERFIPKPEKRALYALYLLDSLAMLEEELSPDASGIEYRVCELKSRIREISV